MNGEGDRLLLALAVPLIGLCGIALGALFTSSRENNKLRRELSLERYREGQELFDELIRLAGERFVSLQRWLWAVLDPDAYELAEVRRAYFDVVRRWNALTWSLRARLRLTLGDELALRFMNYSDDTRTEPLSLHYRFVRVHAMVLSAEQGDKNPKEVQLPLDRLNHAWSEYADDVAVELLQRARRLELLDRRGSKQRVGGRNQ